MFEAIRCARCGAAATGFSRVLAFEDCAVAWLPCANCRRKIVTAFITGAAFDALDLRITLAQWAREMAAATAEISDRQLPAVTRKAALAFLVARLDQCREVAAIADLTAGYLKTAGADNPLGYEGAAVMRFIRQLTRRVEAEAAAERVAQPAKTWLTPRVQQFALPANAQIATGSPQMQWLATLIDDSG